MQYRRRRRADGQEPEVPEKINVESLEWNPETQLMLAGYLTAMGQGNARVQFTQPSTSLLRHESGASTNVLIK